MTTLQLLLVPITKLLNIYSAPATFKALGDTHSKFHPLMWLRENIVTPTDEALTNKGLSKCLRKPKSILRQNKQLQHELQDIKTKSICKCLFFKKTKIKEGRKQLRGIA